MKRSLEEIQAYVTKMGDIVTRMAFLEAVGQGKNNQTGEVMEGTITVCAVCKVQNFKPRLIIGESGPSHQPGCPVPEWVELHTNMKTEIEAFLVSAEADAEESDDA
jgi:hypothetical protein